MPHRNLLIRHQAPLLSRVSRRGPCYTPGLGRHRRSIGTFETCDLDEIMAQSAKKLLKDALDNLPDDATVEEAMERLLFLAKIERGLVEADAGKTLSHEEVRKRLGL